MWPSRSKFGFQRKRSGLVGGDLMLPLVGLGIVLVLMVVLGLIYLSKNMRPAVFVISLLALLAVGGYLLYVTQLRIKQNLLEPLGHLRNWALRMRNGNLSAQIPVPDNGEFAVLANDINGLGESLRALSREMDAEVEKQTNILQQKTTALEVLYEVASMSNTTGNVDKLLVRYLTTLSEIVDAEVATVRVITEDEQLRCIGTLGIGHKITSKEQTIPMERCLCAMNHSTDIIICNTGKSRCGNLLNQSLARNDIEQVISIPLRYQNRTLGLYNLFINQVKYSQDQETEDLLTNIAQHLSLAIEKERLDDESKRVTLMHERTMLAHELHDSLAQTLASLKFSVSLLEKTLAASDDKNAIAEVRQIKSGLEEANNELRELLAHFRVRMDERGLIPAIENLIEQFKNQSDIPGYFQNACSDIKLSPLLEVQVLHIIQESLANIRKHSQAEYVRVLLRRDEDNYYVLIEDDGVGINTDNTEALPGEHVGLTIMQERAKRINGHLNIESEPGEGTRVELEFNYTPDNEKAAYSNLGLDRWPEKLDEVTNKNASSTHR